MVFGFRVELARETEVEGAREDLELLEPRECVETRRERAGEGGGRGGGRRGGGGVEREKLHIRLEGELCMRCGGG